MKLIKRNKMTVLVQDENLFMYHVPVENYDSGEDYTEYLIPYSLSFDIILKQIFNVEGIQKALYARGIHTYEDVLNNRKAVNDILKQYISVDKIIAHIKGDNHD